MNATEPRLDPVRALRLRERGLRWLPAPGDRFFLPYRGMDDEVFVLSDMTVEVHDFPSGRVIGFNGVTEWALDQVSQDEACWLPTEGQLRMLLGGMVRRLERDADAWAVTLDLPGGSERWEGRSPAEAYAAALEDVLADLAGELTG